jgi:hypothetical protein
MYVGERRRSRWGQRKVERERMKGMIKRRGFVKRVGGNSCILRSGKNEITGAGVVNL